MSNCSKFGCNLSFKHYHFVPTISNGFFYYTPGYGNPSPLEKIMEEQTKKEQAPDTERMIRKCDCGGLASGCNSHSDWCSTKS